MSCFLCLSTLSVRRSVCRSVRRSVLSLLRALHILELSAPRPGLRRSRSSPALSCFFPSVALRALSGILLISNTPQSPANNWLMCFRTIALLPPSLYILHLVYIGWVGVGWRRRCKTRLALRGLGSQGTVFFSPLSAVTTSGGLVT